MKSEEKAMILERQFYGVECDGCGCDLEDGCDNQFFTDSEVFAEEVAKDSGDPETATHPTAIRQFLAEVRRYKDIYDPAQLNLFDL